MLYTPDDGTFVGGPEGCTAAFSFTVVDTRGAVPAPGSVTVAVERAFVVGTDRLRGEGFGVDLVYGASGDGTLQGGPDRDRVEGGTGGDLLDGGFGADAPDDGPGADTVRGDDGSDRLVFSGPNRDGAHDVYDGGRVGGDDTDTLVLDRATYDASGFEGEQAAFHGTFDAARGGHAEAFDFASLGLAVEGFEAVEINAGGEVFIA